MDLKRTQQLPSGQEVRVQQPEMPIKSLKPPQRIQVFTAKISCLWTLYRIRTCGRHPQELSRNTGRKRHWCEFQTSPFPPDIFPRVPVGAHPLLSPLQHLPFCNTPTCLPFQKALESLLGAKTQEGFGSVLEKHWEMEQHTRWGWWQWGTTCRAPSRREDSTKRHYRLFSALAGGKERAGAARRFRVGDSQKQKQIYLLSFIWLLVKT